MKIATEINWFKHQLKIFSDSKRAVGEKKYLKSPWKFYGVNTPTKRTIAKQWLKDNSDTSIDEIALLAKKLWQSDWHEEKTLALMLLYQRKKELNLKHLSLLEKLINESTGWEFLDDIAIHLVGALIDKDKSVLKILSEWAKSQNFWVRRAAVLAQILQFRRKQGNKKLFFDIIVPMFDEGKNWSKEERFFIRKAVGWSLREIANVEPKVAFNFVKMYKHKMSGLTFREASRKLPEKLRLILK